MSFIQKLCAAALLLTYSVNAWAQKDIFQQEKVEPKQGMIFGVHANMDFTAADMAKRFGTGWRIGPSLHYKTKTNWIIGIKYEFLLGNRITEDSLLSNVIDENGFAYNMKGESIAVVVQKRGFLAGAYLGKVFPLSNSNPDNGIVPSIGLGFMQHRLHFKAQDDEVMQINKPYNKGYDRLTNGVYIEPGIGYQYMDKNGMLSFYVGASATMGFTKGRRNFLFDVQRSGTDSRLDMMWGLRGGIYIPLIKRNADDIFF